MLRFNVDAFISFIYVIFYIQLPLLISKILPCHRLMIRYLLQFKGKNVLINIVRYILHAT